MELSPIANHRPRGRLREGSLWLDFGRVGASILLGVSGGFAYGLLSQRWDAVFGFVTLVFGPALVLALLWIGTGLRWRTGMRFLGASAGWSGFVLLFVQPAVNQWLLSFYAPVLVLIVAILPAASMVGFGLLIADRIWATFGSSSATLADQK